jgi:hypothetical protein
MQKILFLIAAHSLLLNAFSQKVGIGTTNPEFKFDVRNGSINTDSLYRIGAITVLAVPGSGNLFVGKEAGKVNTGFINTFSGDQAGYTNAGGSFNSFFGGSTGMSNNSGNHNSFFGQSAGLFNAAGSFNSFFGSSAGSNSNGNQNTFIGRNSGLSNTTGSGNTALGFSADISGVTPLTNATAIGANSFVSQNNSLVLGSINGVNGANSNTRVGIGISAPLFALDVKNSSDLILRLDGGPGMYASLNENGIYRGYLGSFSGNAEDVDFGTGGGNTTGRLHLTIQGTPKLTVDAAGNVGIGNTSPAYRLDVNGDMNVTGALRIDGSSGTTGQVLTSNGVSDPTWANAAYGNNTRFGVLFIQNAGSRFGYAVISNTLYNLNTSDVAIGTSSITINKTGLYHFDLDMKSTLVYSTPTTAYPNQQLIFYFGLPYPITPIDERMDIYYNASVRWDGHAKTSVEVYITAPAILQFFHSLGTGGGETVTSYFVNGFVMGHLISE